MCHAARDSRPRQAHVPGLNFISREKDRLRPIVCFKRIVLFCSSTTSNQEGKILTQRKSSPLTYCWSRDQQQPTR